jgi:hypothetical protein
MTALKIIEDRKIYFLKEQKMDFIKILKSMLSRSKQMKEKYIFEKLKEVIQ